MMFLLKDKLWVVTSTVDEKKGILVDVFDREGNYVDNFYLTYPEGVVPYSVGTWIKAASDDFIYSVEKGGEEEVFILKNRIVDPLPIKSGTGTELSSPSAHLDLFLIKYSIFLF